jgi:hypothetical protein
MLVSLSAISPKSLRRRDQRIPLSKYQAFDLQPDSLDSESPATLLDLSPRSRTDLFSGLLSGNLPKPFNFGRNNHPLFQQE